jgi:hypothetical protein
MNNKSLPGINIRELVEERNWTALAGLGLIVIGILYVFGDFIGLDFHLWNVILLGIGGALMLDAWSKYQDNGRSWTEQSRSRMAGGAVITLVGLLSIFDLSGWGWPLLAIGGWLIYDARKKYEQNGRVWVEPARSRMIGGAVIAVIGLFGFVHLLSTWPLVLIILGGAMLFGLIGGKR